MRSEISLMRLAAALGLSLPLVAGCSPDIDTVFNDNIVPEVRLTAAPVSTSDQYFYAFRMNWVGYDPDGRIDYFVYAVDPPAPDEPSAKAFGPDLVPPVEPDSVWQRTPKNEEILFFRASQPDTTTLIRAHDYHTFAIAAVDNDGAISRSVWRSFNSFTLTPSVFVDSPRPNNVFTPITTPTVRIKWHGIDPDGVFTTKPLKYKYKLFRPRDTDFPNVDDPVGLIRGQPKILIYKYAPTFGPNPNCTYCSYWDSTSGDTTEVQYTSLIPNNIYLFAVTGFDEAGAYDPVFSAGTNMLRFAVAYAGTLGPTICMFNEFFNYCYPSGGYANDPTRYFNIEIPTDLRVTFNWFAIPPKGADMRRYRWVLDLQDLTDETPRFDETLDWYHWSAWSLQTLSATIGPFVNNGENHLFYIEAEDNNGLRSLGIISFTVVRATFEEDILFVDDTRLTPDQLTAAGRYDPPRGPWPNAAELDSFFFAQGGKPWIGYPAGTVSRQGIFAGYPGVRTGAPVETTGTRGIASGLVPLARLGKYKLVVWYTDDIASIYTGNPIDLITPISSLRHMSSPGQPSTISTYLKQGGKVWMLGGGAGFATLAAWQKRNTLPDEFTNFDGELVPGRFMYDFAHWRSALTTKPAVYGLLNSKNVLSLVGLTFPPYNSAAPGRGWMGHGPDHDRNMPNYGKLEDFTGGALLTPRTCDADPPSPLRGCNSLYLLSSYTAEFLGTQASAGSNFITEDADPDPDRFREESTLDTLYVSYGGTVPIGRPIMTYYHGFETPSMVFSGFPLWYFSRPRVQALADFVLQDIFGFTRNAPTVVPVPARTRPTAQTHRSSVPGPTSAQALRR